AVSTHLVGAARFVERTSSMKGPLRPHLAPALVVVLLAPAAFAEGAPPGVPLPHPAALHQAAAPPVHPAPAIPHPAQPAPAQPPGLAVGVVKAAALAWAKERNFPVREIEVGPPERRVTRVFVPITPETWPSFMQTFGSGPNRMMLKLKSGDKHLMPMID